MSEEEPQRTTARPLCRPHSPSWSTRFDTTTHSDAPGLVLCSMLSSLSFCTTAVVIAHLKLFRLELSTALLGCQYALANQLYTDLQIMHNRRVHTLFEAEMTSSQFSGSMSHSWKNPAADINVTFVMACSLNKPTCLQARGRYFIYNTVTIFSKL